MMKLKAGEREALSPPWGKSACLWASSPQLHPPPPTITPHDRQTRTACAFVWLKWVICTKLCSSSKILRLYYILCLRWSPRWKYWVWHPQKDNILVITQRKRCHSFYISLLYSLISGNSSLSELCLNLEAVSSLQRLLFIALPTLWVIGVTINNNCLCVCHLVAE